MAASGLVLLPLLQIIHQTSQSPVIYPIKDNGDRFIIPKDFCILPPELGGQGTVKYVEDCDSLDQYPTLPIPVQFTVKVGTHPLVCCPKKRYKDHICFSTDAWCSIYKPIEYPEYEFSGDYDSGNYDIVQQVQPTMADRTCYGTPVGNGMTLDTCVKVDQCPDLLNLAPTNAPQLVMQPCGFDTQDKSLMICCPDSLINKTVNPAPTPRFPLPSGEARECDDKHDLCPTWKSNDGCALDKDFNLSEDPNGIIASKNMFDFMQDTCLGSCKWCGQKGCVDELPDCIVWARNGMCVINPFVMAHTCRESCGVCGFLSPFSGEEQVVDGNSYSDFTEENFDCGRFKLLTEVNPQGPVVEDEITTTEAPELEEDVSANSEDYELDLRSDSEEESDDVFFSSQGLTSPQGGKPDYFCGATVISDRWVVAASHCYDDFGAGASEGQKQVKINTIRENTVFKDIIEIKKVFKHPLYQYPNLYNDVAVLELGRRIEYNWNLYGDSPSCLDRGLFDKPGKIATIQGFGLTEKGTRGELLETNVTIITNSECKETLAYNTTNKIIARRQMEKALPQGLNYGLLCAQGEMDEDGVFKGSCKGDSGGPLTTKNKKDRTTLVGIVSGGVGCGKGYPGWYTRVDFFADWIQCIIQTSKDSFGKGKSQEEILDSCKHTIKDPKKCEDLTADDLLFGDLRSVDDENTCAEKTEDEIKFGGLTVDDILFGDLRNEVAK